MIQSENEPYWTVFCMSVDRGVNGELSQEATELTTGGSLISLLPYQLPVLATSVTCHPLTGTGNQAEYAVELS